MDSTTSNALSQVVVLDNGAGITVVPTGTPLTRLNYFDGKFMRATDFALEQLYMRQLVALSNQGLGGGVVYGFDTTLGDGDMLQIGPGLGIAPGGSVLLLPGGVSVGVQDLIDASRRQPAVSAASAKAKKIEPNAVFTGGVFSDCVDVAPPPPSTVVPAGNLYVVLLCSAEALCGQQDVVGSVCDAACVTNTDRPYRIEGVVLRAIPLQLVAPFPTSKTVPIDADLYLRSKVAHAYFADEVARHPARISREGLLSETWCLGAGYDPSCCEVPIAVIARSGAPTTFLDPWIARRERMSAPAHRYWQWRMLMRPWEVFMAQVLQFQCQLAEVLTGVGAPDPTVVHQKAAALGNAAQFLDGLRTNLKSAPANAGLLGLSFTHLADLQQQLQLALKNTVISAAADRVLIRGGIIELPSTGYLPVVPGSSISVNAQVRALLGEGLDLRFCVVTPDYVAHALEEAQHMDRISLLQGLDDPNNKPRVDILVPGGALAPATTATAGGLFDAALTVGIESTGASYKGAAREETLAPGGAAVYSAGAGLSLDLVRQATALGKAGAAGKIDAAAVAPNLEKNATAKLDPLSVSTFLARLAAARAAAAAGAGPAAAKATSKKSAAKAKALEAELTIGSRTIDGYWLTARTERRLRDLPPFQQSAVSGRAIAGTTKANINTDTEVSFQGSLTATDVNVVPGVGPIVKAHVDIMFTIETAKATGPGTANPDTEQDLTTFHRQRADVVLTYDDLAGTVTLDVYDSGNQVSSSATPGPVMRFVRAATATTVEYTAFDRVNLANGPVLTALAKLTLTADADVSRAANPLHLLAVSGLDLVQGAIAESEPSFENVAAAQLFPPVAPNAPSEATIQAVNDWVLFHKRREKSCTGAPAVAPPLPPRTYRVLNFTASSADAARKLIETWRANAAELAAAVTKLMTEMPDLVIGYQGGTSQPLFDPTAAEADWVQFKPAPGDRIAGVIYGARGDDDASTQTARLKRFEQAIAADSLEDPSLPSSQIDFPIVPFPEAAIPPDADGVMLFVTVPTTEAQHVYGMRDDIVWSDVLDHMKKKNLDAAFLATLDDLGVAPFAHGTSTPVGTGDAGVVSAFKARYGSGASVIGAAAVYSSSEDAKEQQAHLDQSKLVANDLGGQPNVAKQPYAGALPITDASALTFVLARTTVRVARVVVEQINFEGPTTVINSDPTLILKMDDQGLVGGALPANILALKTNPQRSLTAAVAPGGNFSAADKDVAALLQRFVSAGIVPAGIVATPAQPVSAVEKGLLAAGVDELIVLSSAEVIG